MRMRKRTRKRTRKTKAMLGGHQPCQNALFRVAKDEGVAVELEEVCKPAAKASMSS
jgi:hypothetical protein